MRPPPRRARATRWILVAAATLAGPALIAACGARNQLEVDVPAATGAGGAGGAGGTGGTTPDAAPDVPSLDAPPDVIPVDAPADAILVDAPPDVTPVDLHGCADGTREAFLDIFAYPDIAACSGGFSLPGIVPFQPPACGRQGGNDGPHPSGQGCNAADLCAAGFHVCESAGAVSKHSPTGCAGAQEGPPQTFFITGQSGTGCGVCATGSMPGCGADTCELGCAQNDKTTNDVFGCGNAGDAPDPSCGPLDAFSNNDCADLPPGWFCEGETTELLTVTNTGPSGGGALCCRD
jgi:hypothetical protein